MNRDTIFSPCRRYRYTLWREWEQDLLTTPKGYLMIVGLNPSTADETQDDPTIRRCIDFAKRWGHSALCMTNLFAWRDTDPEKMKQAEDPVGPENDRLLRHCAGRAALVLAAWGKHGAHLDRARTVCAMLANLHCLKLNGDGSPSHPLYLPATITPAPFTLSNHS